MKAAVHQVKAKFSSYVALAEQGTHIVIMRHDKPVAELRPIGDALPPAPRVAGSAAGLISYTDDAFAPMSDQELDELDQQPLFPEVK